MEQLSPQTCLTPSSPGSSAPDPDTLLVAVVQGRLLWSRSWKR